MYQREVTEKYTEKNLDMTKESVLLSTVLHNIT